MSRAARVSVLCIVLWSTPGCLSNVYEHRYSMTRDVVVWDFGQRADLYSTALLVADGGYVVLWTDREGLWSVLVNRSFARESDPVLLARSWAGSMSAADLGGACEPLGARYAVALAGRTSVLEGRGDLEILLLDGSGHHVSSTALVDEVGPYTSGMNLSGSCDGLLVAWHKGAIGRFESRVASIDVRKLEKRWERTLNAPGVNGFCPSPLPTRSGFDVFWGEVKVSMRDPGDEDDPGRIMHVRMNEDGSLDGAAHPVLETLRVAVPPSIVDLGSGLAMLYKDHPEDEDREGIYLALLDRHGSVVGAPRRIGRGDGPDPALLLRPVPDVLSTAAVRSLSNELLIGLNFLDLKGAKLSGELQIYAHQVRFRRLAALSRDGEVVLLYVEQGTGDTRLLVTTVARIG